jgi:hypothetical protein
MTPRQMRAPTNDGDLLVEPAPPAVAGQLAQNARRLADWDYDFQGKRAGALRDLARREVVTAARSYLTRHGLHASAFELDAAGASARPLIVTGHQPELFHPGVWIKNFAAGAMAAAHRGIGLNLIVDNDIPKSSSIRVPTLQGDLIRLRRVDFDRWGGDVPFEDLAVREEGSFLTFADRVRQVAREAAAGSLLDDFWPRVLARRAEALTAGGRFSLARRELEASWGLSNLEVPLSALCQTDGFLWFVSHLLAQLPRYHQIHNTALSEYRAAHRIRSNNHPVASLERHGEWLEAPFWIWRKEQPRRRGLLVRQRSPQAMELRIAGEDQVLLELPLGADREACCAVERLRELAARSIRLRTRALTTTMFSRFLLGDLFIHGIGGAKYDELGDEIARRYFLSEPPGFLTLSLTLWLDLPVAAESQSDLNILQRRLRDLQFNPDRYLCEPYSDEIRTLIQRKQHAACAPTSSRRDRRARYLNIRAVNAALQPWVSADFNSLLERRAQICQRLRSNRAARNREFAFVLHRFDKLKRHIVDSVQLAWPNDNAIIQVAEFRQS